MGEILFLAHRIPFPPDRGDKIRSHHLLRALADIAPVHVATFAETAADWDQRAPLAEVASTQLVRRRRKPMFVAGIEALATGKPVSLTAFADRALAAWVRRTLKTCAIDTIFVFSGQMGQYIPDDFAGRVIVDLCDVDSAKFGGYAQEARGPRRWLLAREERRLRAVEARLADRADTVLLVSENEKALLHARLPGRQATNLRALGNGIDATFFDPTYAAADPAIAELPGPHFVFTGQMDYPPNVAAALRGIERLLPALRRARPEAEFHVVGRAPTAELRGFDGRDGVTVWGEVADVRPFLLAADAVVVPLTLARGVQNKVLEAMAMCRPVVVTPQAATGIDAEDGTHFLIAEGDAEIVAALLALTDDRDTARRLGRMARDFVLRQHSWIEIAESLRGIMGRAPTDDRDAN